MICMRGVTKLIVAACAILLASLHASARAAQVSTPAILAAESREILVMLRLSADHYRPAANYGGDYSGGVTSISRKGVALRIARRHQLGLVEGWAMPLMGLDCYVMRVPPGRTIEAAISQVSRDPLVAWSEPMQVYRAKGGRGGTFNPLFAAEPAATLWHLSAMTRS